jgi:hypothetical protein
MKSCRHLNLFNAGKTNGLKYISLLCSHEKDILPLFIDGFLFGLLQQQ